MVRLLIVLTMAVTMIGVAFASAATLTVDGGVLQAGADDDLTCDDDGVVALTWGFDQSTGEVDRVRVGRIHDDCVGYQLYVNLTDDMGNVIDEADPVTIPNNDGTENNFATVIFDSAHQVADIHDVHVFILSEFTVNP